MRMSEQLKQYFKPNNEPGDIIRCPLCKKHLSARVHDFWVECTCTKFQARNINGELDGISFLLIINDKQYRMTQFLFTPFHLRVACINDNYAIKIEIEEEMNLDYYNLHDQIETLLLFK
jgi:hypothetical protein